MPNATRSSRAKGASAEQDNGADARPDPAEMLHEIAQAEAELASLRARLAPYAAGTDGDSRLTSRIAALEAQATRLERTLDLVAHGLTVAGRMAGRSEDHDDLGDAQHEGAEATADRRYSELLRLLERHLGPQHRGIIMPLDEVVGERLADAQGDVRRQSFLDHIVDLTIDARHKLEAAEEMKRAVGIVDDDEGWWRRYGVSSPTTSSSTLESVSSVRSSSSLPCWGGSRG